VQHFVSKTKPNVFEKNPDHSKFPEVRRQRLAPRVHIVPNRDIVLPKTLNTSAQVLTHVNKALMKDSGEELDPTGCRPVCGWVGGTTHVCNCNDGGLGEDHWCDESDDC